MAGEETSPCEMVPPPPRRVSGEKSCTCAYCIQYVLKLMTLVDVSLVYNETTKIQTTLQDAMKASSFTWASTVASAKETLKTNMQTVVDAVKKLDI